jgi:hypothetical protein
LVRNQRFGTIITHLTSPYFLIGSSIQSIHWTLLLYKHVFLTSWYPFPLSPRDPEDGTDK